MIALAILPEGRIPGDRRGADLSASTTHRAPAAWSSFIADRPSLCPALSAPSQRQSIASLVDRSSKNRIADDMKPAYLGFRSHAAGTIRAPADPSSRRKVMPLDRLHDRAPRRSPAVDDVAAGLPNRLDEGSRAYRSVGDQRLRNAKPASRMTMRLISFNWFERHALGRFSFAHHLAMSLTPPQECSCTSACNAPGAHRRRSSAMPGSSLVVHDPRRSQPAARARSSRSET